VCVCVCVCVCVWTRTPSIKGWVSEAEAALELRRSALRQQGLPNVTLSTSSSSNPQREGLEAYTAQV